MKETHTIKEGYTGSGYTPNAIRRKARVKPQTVDTPEAEIEGIDLHNSFVGKITKYDKYNRNLLKVKKH